MSENEDEIDEKVSEKFNAKHIRLRGSLEYKYPPMGQACKLVCGLNDCPGEKGKWSDHVCVLVNGHDGAHEWSSECGLMRR